MSVPYLLCPYHILCISVPLRIYDVYTTLIMSVPHLLCLYHTYYVCTHTLLCLYHTYSLSCILDASKAS